MGESVNEKARPPSFIVDSMLGKLARWLRILGFDTFYTKEAEDEDLLRISIQEDRYILTRDRELYRRAYPRSALIEEMDLDSQLKEVVEIFSLSRYNLPTRCPLCNTTLRKVEREKLRGIVPEGTFDRYRVFYICPNCRKVYWHGSHWDKIVKRAGDAGFNTQNLKNCKEE